MAERIAFIGLGIMGRPMALNLLEAGHVLRVHARRPESMSPLVEAGATPCASPREAAATAHIVFTMVSDSADVEQVILGADGVADGLAPGGVVVDMSTISPLATRAIAARLGERGLDMLDAPVSGGEKGAQEASLSIMVGGRADVFERVLPLFQAMGRNIVHIGEHGAGQVAKACNQVLITQTIAAIGEAFLLAQAAGVDPRRVREALLGGFAGSRALESHGLRMLEGDYRPGFKVRLHQKDMRIVMQTAAQLGLALPGAALVTDYIDAAMAQGMGEDDSIAIYRLQQALCGGH